MTDLDEINQVMLDREEDRMMDDEYAQWRRNFLFSRNKEQLMKIIEAVYE